MTDELRSRLKRLRRDLDRPTPADPSWRATLPTWFVERAARAANSDAPSSAAPANETHPRTSGEPRDLVETSNAFGRHAVRALSLPREHVHGEWRLDEALGANANVVELLTGDESLAAFDVERALFLDIETTGLSGGAGTHVYLIGLGRFERGGFEAWQGFARGPEEEASLLASCAERVRESSALVTFFGKSFDRHRLEDKMRVHKIEPPFAGRAHFDLYHSCRKLYGKSFVDGRLATMERELCGVRRERDLPGSFAPAAWFDFLAGREHLLEEVFRHNFDDVLSLVTLAAHLACSDDERRVDGSELGGPRAARRLALARSLAANGEWARALDRLDSIESAELASLELRPLRAEILRRLDRPRESLRMWRELATSRDALGARASFEAARLAAKLGQTDARELAERARELAPRTLAGSACARLEQAAAKLLARLDRGL